MTEQWQELKETITEMRDNNGTCTQQEVCKFLANLMEILEKQMQEPRGDLISRQAVLEIQAQYAEHIGATKFWQMRDNIKALPSVKQEPKTGHWIEDDMTYCGVDLTNYKCDKCGEIGGSWRKGLKPDKLPKYCMNCGCRMVEPQEERDEE